MTKIDFAQINRVAVTAFVICLVAGVLVGVAMQPSVAGDRRRTAGRVFPVRHQSRTAMGEGCAAAPGQVHRPARARPFIIVPVVETLSRYVDQRVRVANVTAESTLTRDTVPVNVDAIVFWLVWNAEKSILEVENFIEAINMSAQTALRESIGRHELAQMITERETLGRELQRILDEKTNPWGITVQSVEIRDVRFRRLWKTPCRARRRPSANGRRASSWARQRPRSPTTLCRLRPPTRKIPWRCICAP